MGEPNNESRNPMPAVAYIRVSTKQQDENNQRKMIEKYAREHGYMVINYFIDKGESRMKKWRNRPGARALVNFLENGGNKIVKAVLIFDMTRLGADMLDVLELFKIIEEENGVRVISITDEWLQMDDEQLRKLLIAIFTWVAEQELKLRRERQLAAWESGKPKGRPPKLTVDEVKKYLSRYPNLSVQALTDIINADRRRNGLPEVSYWTVYEKVRKLRGKK